MLKSESTLLKKDKRIMGQIFILMLFQPKSNFQKNKCILK